MTAPNRPTKIEDGTRGSATFWALRNFDRVLFLAIGAAVGTVLVQGSEAGATTCAEPTTQFNFYEIVRVELPDGSVSSENPSAFSDDLVLRAAEQAGRVIIDDQEVLLVFEREE